MATSLASQWEVLPWRGQEIDVGTPGGTRDTGWGYPWWDSKRVVINDEAGWLGLIWFEMGAAVLSCTEFIGLSLPSKPDFASVHHLCTSSPPWPPMHTCIWTLPTAWSFWNNDLNCLSLHHSHCFICLTETGSLPRRYPLSVPVLSVMRWHWLGILLTSSMLIPQEMLLSGVCVPVCVFLWGFVWGIAARALACCALSARSFRFVCGVDVWLNGNWWVCKGQH